MKRVKKEPSKISLVLLLPLEEDLHLKVKHRATQNIYEVNLLFAEDCISYVNFIIDFSEFIPGEYDVYLFGDNYEHLLAQDMLEVSPLHTHQILYNWDVRRIVNTCQNEFVTLTLTGENCTLYGGGTYLKGTKVRFFVLPDKDFTFLGWSDGDERLMRDIVLEEDTVLEARIGMGSECELQQKEVMIGVGGVITARTLLIEQNGEYTAPDGVIYNKIVVNVSGGGCEMQEKEVFVGEEGVLIPEEITITQPGVYKGLFSKIVCDPALQEKEIDITESDL